MIQFKATKAQIVGHVVAYASQMRPNRPYTVIIKEWRRPRTTGPQSQNNHLHGHERQIAAATGNSMEAIDFYIMGRAMNEYDYPVEYVREIPQPLPQVSANTQQFGTLIEMAHRLAADLDIKLREETEWGVS